MGKKAFLTRRAPEPIGPYSQAIQTGKLVFLAGQIPLDPASGRLIEGDIVAQTRRAMDNVMAVLGEVGLGPDHVVKTTIYLADMADFPAMNEVYGSYFKGTPPARSAIQAARLPKDARIEIDVIAFMP
jgi:2-iminobutanoate/2-iminopropanoate deaminase